MWQRHTQKTVSHKQTFSVLTSNFDCFSDPLPGIWRNRDHFLKGSEKIVEFLTKKWEKEKNYKLRKELFAFTGNKIAVQFWYEYQVCPRTLTLLDGAGVEC